MGHVSGTKPLIPDDEVVALLQKTMGPPTTRIEIVIVDQTAADREAAGGDKS